MSGVWRKLTNWLLNEPPAAVIVLRPCAEPLAPVTRSEWTGAGSLTERQILHHLQYGPMTRRELESVMDVTTAGILLPRLVERGLVKAAGVPRQSKGRQRIRYELTDVGLDQVMGRS